jgi:DNA-binding NarL/FixJ family response regulator
VIKVLLADDHELVRDGLKAMLGAQEDIEVVAEASDGAEAVEKAIRLRPDVVLMDIRMPRLDGIEATRRLNAHAGAPRVLVLTTFDLDEYVYEALRAGAAGFILKDVPPRQVAEAVRTVAAGDQLLAPAVTKRLVERFVKRPPPDTAREQRFEQLTEREVEVLRHVARGLSNAEIAERLFLSEATVKTHLTRILSKLRLRDRVQAVVLAYEAAWSSLAKASRPSPCASRWQEEPMPEVWLDTRSALLFDASALWRALLGARRSAVPPAGGALLARERTLGLGPCDRPGGFETPPAGATGAYLGRRVRLRPFAR